MRIRSTFYYAVSLDGQGNEFYGRTATGVPLREANTQQVGVAAVDPAIIPFGSLITVSLPDATFYYIAADTGPAIKSQAAAQGTEPVVCFFSKVQIGDEYTEVNVVPYSGATPYSSLTDQRKNSFFNIKKYV
jgi:3D (Asp-Asp-Asp) domain-containing protein